MNSFYRPQPSTEITYLAISKRYEQNNFLIDIPEEFKQSGLLSFIKQCPKDLLQLGQSFDFYESALKLDFPIPLNFNITYEDKFDEIKSFYSKIPQVKVFLIDVKISNLEKVVTELQRLNSLSFFYFYNLNASTELPIFSYKNIIDSPLDLIDKIYDAKEEIIKILTPLKEFPFKPTLNQSKSNTIHSFAATQNNYWTLNQLFNNYWVNREKEFKGKEKTWVDDSLKARENSSSFQRQDILLNQVKMIDWFDGISYQEKLNQIVNGNEPIINPLIFISPYHNPQVKKILAEIFRGKQSGKNNFRVLEKGLREEQTNNYTGFVLSEDFNNLENAKLYLTSQKLVAQKLRLLDDIGYLHASFFNCPVFRAPLKGKSINRELSFFSPSTFRGRINPNKKKKIKKTIEVLGRKLSENISPKVINHLENRDGQIVAISDLPIEWMDINGIPLCFTHDICRVPETPVGGALNHFVSNNNNRISIGKQSLKNTLVIYGSDEPLFQSWRSIVESYKAELGFNSALCKTIDEVKASVDKHRPDILIFDCHGGVDFEDLSTHLWINNEKLTNTIIKEKGIVAPIIFLSACGTAPNYGFFNTIAQGFFEAGSLSVTTTFMPVDINVSSMLYVRLLRQLKKAIEQKMHKNWLGFLSHIVRTSSVFEAINYARNKAISRIDFEEEKLSETHLNSVVELMFFSKRRKVYFEMDKRISNINKRYSNAFSSQIPEYLFYSHLGRPDLIYFEDWLTEKRKLNNGK